MQPGGVHTAMDLFYVGKSEIMKHTVLGLNIYWGSTAIEVQRKGDVTMRSRSFSTVLATSYNFAWKRDKHTICLFTEMLWHKTENNHFQQEKWQIRAAMGSFVRELQAVLSVYLGIMVEGSVTGLSAVAIPDILRFSKSTLGRCGSISSNCPDNHCEPEDNHFPYTQPIFHWCQEALWHYFLKGMGAWYLLMMSDIWQGYWLLGGGG